ncbi:MAG: CHAT domain-containing protein, partial [bacterium]|nr:CHAT domain-containing protein [bacterium]
SLPPSQPIRSVVTIPSLPAPVLALLATEGGVIGTEEVSLRQPLTVRPINRVAVWQGGTMHEGFEVEALERVASLAGWTIDVQGGDVPAFERFYADPSADLLWVIGHGEHSPHRIENSGLVIGEELVTADRLRGLAPAGEGRRLLVLNVCSGATAQVRGGMARIGIGQELTGPGQQVAAHLWPVGMYAGLAFGAKFALELSAAPTSEAYARTVAGMRDPAALRADLVTRLGSGLAIHDRLAHQDAQIGNVMAWGAPVLLT